MLPFGAIATTPPANPENLSGAAGCGEIAAASLRRIELVRQNHSFAENARLGVTLGGFLGRAGRKLMQNALEFLVEKARDEFGRVQDRLALLVEHTTDVAMAHALRDHQAIDAIGGEVFHVAIEQAGAAAAEHAVAIANHSAHCRAGAGYGVLANSGGNGAQVGTSFVVCGARLQLIGSREL